MTEFFHKFRLKKNRKKKSFFLYSCFFLGKNGPTPNPVLSIF